MGQDGYRWQNGRVCGGHPVRVEVLDDLVWESVKQLMKEPEMMLKEYTNRTEEKSKWALNSDSMKDRKDRELRKAQHERERLIELYQQSLVTLEDIEPKLKQVRTRIVKIEAELHYLQQEKERQNRQLQLIESFESFLHLHAVNSSTPPVLNHLSQRSFDVERLADPFHHIAPKYRFRLGWSCYKRLSSRVLSPRLHPSC